MDLYLRKDIDQQYNRHLYQVDRNIPRDNRFTCQAYIGTDTTKKNLPEIGPLRFTDTRFTDITIH
jgi:hypothetical protein